MRFYDIQILDPATGQLATRPSLSGTGAPYRWTSWVFYGGRWQNDPGAPLVEFDISTTAWALPNAAAFVRVWGISLQNISQASNLSGKIIKVYGGMKPGLPLATAQAPQAGLLTTGIIRPAFGNWQGTDQTLDLIIQAYVGHEQDRINLSFNWQAGQSLAAALAATLRTAFPNMKQIIDISPSLFTSYAQPGFYGNIDQFATWVKQRTNGWAGNDDYHGVDITFAGGEIIVTDDTSVPVKTTQIQFQDLIGQPTWIGINDIQIKTVLRADIQFWSLVKLPPTIVTNTAASSLPQQPRNNSSFQGTFRVRGLRHVGNSRQPDGDSWTTIIDAIPYQASIAQPEPA